MSAGSTDCQRLVIMKLSVRAWKESRPGNVGRRTSLRKNRDEGCFHGYQLEANSPRGNPVLCLWRKMLIFDEIGAVRARRGQPIHPRSLRLLVKTSKAVSPPRANLRKQLIEICEMFLRFYSKESERAALTVS